MADGTSNHAVTRVPAMRRRLWPLWVYYPARVLLVVLLWPILKIFELFGVFPGSFARAFNRMTLSVPPFEPAANDVLIASFFKSGTNWTMQTAAQVAHRAQLEFAHIHDLVSWYELPERQRFTAPMSADHVRDGAVNGLRIIKTHLPISVLGYRPQGLYIWVIRDPKDVFVSSYHFVRNVMLGPAMSSVEKWLEVFLSHDCLCGSWAEHVKGGWEHRNRDNVLFLTYEQMKHDPQGSIGQMATLMGVALSATELSEVVRRSSFDYMKAHSDQFDTVGMGPPWIRPTGTMVRRGQRGGASELLTDEDQRRIDDYWREELARIGCDFPYDEYYGC